MNYVYTTKKVLVVDLDHIQVNDDIKVWRQKVLEMGFCCCLQVQLLTGGGIPFQNLLFFLFLV